MATKRQLIKKDLLKQMDQKGITGRQFVDLVEDYMALYDLKNKLINDLNERGAMIKWQNGENQFGFKKNDSVSELPKVNKQMLSLLKELGLQAVPVEGVDEDEVDV